MRKLILFLAGWLLLIPCLLKAQAPVANFSALIDSSCGATLTNSFTDFSTNKPTHWKWYFPGATPDTSTLRNPTNIQYNGYGCYNVKLVVSNNNGSDSLTKSNYVCLDQPLKVYFTGPTDLCMGSQATITAYGGTQYHWSTGQTTSSINITGVVTKTYTIQVRSGACFLDTSFTVHVDTMPVFGFRFQGDTAICIGDTTIIYAYPRNANMYLWSTGSTADSIVVIGTKPGKYAFYLNVVKGACSRDSSEVIVDVLNCFAGIDKYSELLGVELYPNPVSCQLLLQSNIPSGKNTVLTITDLTGRKVFNELIGSENLYNFSIDVSSLSAGIYFLQLQTDRGSVIKKFVKE